MSKSSDERRHLATIEALKASPRCVGISPMKGSRVIFLPTPKAVAAFKKTLGR